ncbi:MAG: BMP family ABC transporter substrate-binding protein, partial [Hungatella hathewayi]|nr:BMP family ABC transporter substrate-binding protein [Hungatella hathewayi]
MKKVWAICLTAALTAGMLAGCGSAKTSDTAGESVSTKASVGEEKKDGDLSVLLLVPGTLGDKSFFDSANAGLALIEDHYGASTKVVEMGTDITKYSATLEDVIHEGWDIIITGGVNISQPLQEAAEEYPNQKFILYDESVDFSDGANSNIYCMTYK